MFFQTNTTIGLIAYVLTFLTKNTLCSGTQQTNAQNKPEFEKLTWLVEQWAGEGGFSGVIKNTTDTKIKYCEHTIEELNEKYKNDLNQYNEQKDKYESGKLFIEILITLGKDVLQLKEGFTEEKYEEFLKNVDNSIKEMKVFESKNSFKYSENSTKTILEIPEKSEEIFTADVVDKEERKKRINIIKKVIESRKNNITKKEPTKKEPTKDKRSLNKVFLWGGIILVVFALMSLVIYKHRGDLKKFIKKFRS